MSTASDKTPPPSSPSDQEPPLGKGEAEVEENAPFSSSSPPSKDDVVEEEGSTKNNTDETEEGGEEEDANNSTNTDSDPMILLTKALTLKDEGNDHFKRQEFTKASRSYKKGINLIKHLHSSYKNDNKNNNSSDSDISSSSSNIINNDDEQITALLISLNSNLSMVLYKEKNYDQSKSIATHIITKLDSKNSKAFYRRGLCYKQLSNYYSSKSDLYTAYQLLLDGDNNKEKNAIRKEYNIVKKIYESKAVKDDEKQKKALAKAFSFKGGSGGKASGGSLLYDDKEEEMKKKELQKQEEKKRKKELREKRKLQWEKDCVDRLSNGEEQKDIPSFEEYEKKIEKEAKQEEEKRKKLKKEQEDLERRRRREEQKKNQKNDDTSDDDDDDELTESELKSLRGYKKTSDGRTTSYFTREQTEEEKKLLGSIAPKKLEPSVAVAATGAATGTSLPSSSHVPQRLDSSVSSSSKWNQAGTWEERDASEWCNTALEQFLKESKVTCTVTDAFTFHGSIKTVKDLKGDASVAFVSGKKRYVFDYNTNLSYEIAIEKPCDSADNVGDNEETTENDNEKKKSTVVVAKGSFHLPDISSTSISDEEIEVHIMKWKKEPKEMYKRGAMECRGNLVDKIRENVFAFVSAFNAQY